MRWALKLSVTYTYILCYNTASDNLIFQVDIEMVLLPCKQQHKQVIQVWFCFTLITMELFFMEIGFLPTQRNR